MGTTLAYRELLSQHPFADTLAVVGEGEDALVSIVERARANLPNYRDKKQYVGIPNVAINVDGKLEELERQVVDLTTYPQFNSEHDLRVFMVKSLLVKLIILRPHEDAPGASVHSVLSKICLWLGSLQLGCGKVVGDRFPQDWFLITSTQLLKRTGLGVSISRIQNSWAISELGAGKTPISSRIPSCELSSLRWDSLKSTKR